MMPTATFRVSLRPCLKKCSGHLLVLGTCALLNLSVLGGPEWPQHLGPTRSGGVEDSLALDWKDEGPPVAWQVEIGAGFSGPVVKSGRVYLHDRKANEERWTCWLLGTGEQLWQTTAPTHYRDDFGFDDGPRATPALTDDRAITLGADGKVRAWNLTDGRLEWEVDLMDQLGADKGFFGFASSPLVLGNRVFIQAGGQNGAGVVALRIVDGKVEWKATRDEAGYGSPVSVPENVGGPKSIVAFNRSGLVRLSVSDGRELDRFPWRSRLSASVNAATPWVGTNGVFITASYGTGAAWLEWTGDTWAQRWTGDDILSSHYATPVVHDGHIYGYHGRQEQGMEFRCIALHTGKVLWRKPRLPAGSVIRIGPTLLLLLETGELVAIDVSPVQWTERARSQILGYGTRALPAWVSGRFLARDTRHLIVLDLSP